MKNQILSPTPFGFWFGYKTEPIYPIALVEGNPLS
jgi:hypothetical protein